MNEEFGDNSKTQELGLDATDLVNSAAIARDGTAVGTHSMLHGCEQHIPAASELIDAPIEAGIGASVSGPEPARCTSQDACHFLDLGMQLTKDDGDQGLSSMEISNEYGLNAPVIRDTEIIDRVATSEIISDHIEIIQKEMNNPRFHGMPRYMLQSLSNKMEYGPILPMVQWQMLSRVWILSSALR